VDSQSGHPPNSTAAAPRPTGLVRWHVADEWREWKELLSEPAGLRLEQWLDSGQAHEVKTGEHRTVYRLDLPHGTFYVKHYHGRYLLGPGRHLVQASASRREFHKAVEVGNRNVPTVRPVAFGEQVRGGLVHESFLVTEGVENSSSVREYILDRLPQLPRAERCRARRKLAVALAELCATAHRAGVDHDDLHAGNVLVRHETYSNAGEEEDALPGLQLIDLPGVRLSRPLNWARSRASLAMFNSGWWDCATSADQWRFWKAYVARRPDLKLGRSEALEVVAATREYSRRILAKRGKRTLRNNRDYYSMHGSQGTGHAVSDLPRRVLRDMLEEPEQWLRTTTEPSGRAEAAGGRTTAKTHLPRPAEQAPVALQHYWPTTWWESLLDGFRRSRAVRAWCWGHALLERGIATARPLAVCEVRRGAWRREAYVVNQWIEDAVTLCDYGRRLAELEPRARLLRRGQVAYHLGRLIGGLHAWGIGHGDLRADHLLVVERDDDVELYLIDLDAVRFLRRVSQRAQAKELARMAERLASAPWLTRTDLARILQAYGRTAAPKCTDWKTVAWRTAQAISAADVALTASIRSPMWRKTQFRPAFLAR